MDRQIGHLLRRAYAVARKNTADALAVLGDVSPVQASAIATLAGGAMTPAELGRRIGMEPANTHTLVKRLDAAGFTITRRATGNLRSIALTEAGSALAARLADTLALSNAETLAPLDTADRDLLFGLLRKVARVQPE